MNKYRKFAANVYVVETKDEYKKGDKIQVTTRSGGTHVCTVYNFLGYARESGLRCYSIVREGFNAFKNKADKYREWAVSAQAKSNASFESAKEGREFLSLGEPIKIGHHSERRHRALIDRNWNRMGKSVAFAGKAEAHLEKAERLERRASQITLAMPESLEYFTEALEAAKAHHVGLKDGSIKRQHSFDVQYANKKVKDLQQKVNLAQRLWGDE